jgi:hypothetical protein
MSENETYYYRLHPADAPEFDEANAWSALWGRTRSADGSQTLCNDCDGEGEGYYGEACSVCGGEGWQDAQRGYSCCYSSEDLTAYFTARGIAGDDDTVIVFAGTRVGNGFDGEPLVVPTRVVERITWAQLRARVTA